MNTNLFKRVWSAVLACLLFVGCKEPEQVIMYDVQLSLNSVCIDACGGERTIEVTPFLPGNDSWSVKRTGAEEWFECRTDKNTIIIHIEPNSDTSARKGEFEVVSAKRAFSPRKITVTQEAFDEAILLVEAPHSYAFDSAASSYTFGVSCNIGWDITTTEEWITLHSEPEAQRATIAVEANDGEMQRSGIVKISSGNKAYSISVTQDTHANNPYYKLLGKWEITASKWFYSPNGSLNSLDYAPNPTDYYLIFDLEEVEYGKRLKMRNFLYPGTELEVSYNAKTGGITIPFGWTVLSYDVFLYITFVGSKQFAYESSEVNATPNDDTTALTLEFPSVDGFNYVGFGLWTYDENGNKIAVGSNYRPTMFPMGDVKFVKKSE